MWNHIRRLPLWILGESASTALKIHILVERNLSGYAQAVQDYLKEMYVHAMKHPLPSERPMFHLYFEHEILGNPQSAPGVWLNPKTKNTMCETLQHCIRARRFCFHPRFHSCSPETTYSTLRSSSADDSTGMSMEQLVQHRNHSKEPLTTEMLQLTKAIRSEFMRQMTGFRKIIKYGKDPYKPPTIQWSGKSGYGQNDDVVACAWWNLEAHDRYKTYQQLHSSGHIK